MTILWDWQFLIVSAIALGALLVLVRPFLPARGRGADGGAPSKPSGCAHCASNADNQSASASRPPARTVMTQVVSLRDLRDTARQIKH